MTASPGSVTYYGGDWTNHEPPIMITPKRKHYFRLAADQRDAGAYGARWVEIMNPTGERVLLTVRGAATAFRLCNSFDDGDVILG